MQCKILKSTKICSILHISNGYFKTSCSPSKDQKRSIKTIKMHLQTVLTSTFNVNRFSWAVYGKSCLVNYIGFTRCKMSYITFARGDNDDDDDVFSDCSSQFPVPFQSALIEMLSMTSSLSTVPFFWPSIFFPFVDCILKQFTSYDYITSYDITS